MKQHFTDERTSISYTLQGDYYLSELALPAEEQVEVGIWGQRHLQYIKAHRKGFYTTLPTKCELNRHLVDVNKQAEDMFFRLVKEIAEHEGVTEQLKADNQMEWVARMNNIRSMATEIVNHDIIYNQPKHGGRDKSLPFKLSDEDCSNWYRNFYYNMCLDLERMPHHKYVLDNAQLPVEESVRDSRN